MLLGTSVTVSKDRRFRTCADLPPSERMARWFCVHLEFFGTLVDNLYELHHLPLSSSHFQAGSFDSSVHISEEASNAATAVPWAIVNAIGIAGILGWGMFVLDVLR